MKKTMKNLLMLLMVFAFLIGGLYVPEQTANVSGKISTKKYNWDLEGDAKVSVGAWFYGWDFGSMYVTLKDYKVKDASKKGYKKISFTYEAVPDEGTLDMIEKTKGYYDNEKGKFLKGKKYVIEPVVWFAVFDYKSGECLDIKNSHDVTVKNSKWKGVYEKLKKGKGTRYWKKSSSKVEITYPKSYKNMVIAVGGFNAYGKNGEEYRNGECSFFKTDMYKNGTNGKDGESDIERISLMRVK